MREITADDFIDVKAPEVVVFKTQNGFYSAIQNKDEIDYTNPVIKWLAVNAFNMVIQATKGLTVHAGELVPVRMIFETEQDILWYEDPDYSMKDRARRFLPLSADDAIHKWAQTDDLVLYEVV